MPTIECMHERMQPEHDYCPDCGKTQTAESRAIRTLRARAERAEAALRQLGKHPESCGDDCVSELARLDVLAERDALRAALIEATEMVEHWGGYASDYFQKKWNLEGDLTKLRAAIAAESQS